MRSSLDNIAAVLAAAFVVLAAAAGMAEESEYFIKSRVIPPAYKGVAEFLEYLKPAKEAPGGFDLSVAPPWDVERLMSYMSEKGLAVSDVNRGGKLQRLSAKEVRSSVMARKGQTFQMLVHLGYIYAQPYKQYSELKFEPQAGGVVVHMAQWYRLTFDLPAGQTKLTRLDYLTREGH
jgi:hypothetical protein